MKIQGTRSYMSPEQIRGKGIDQRSDIYSLACMLHELVAGKPPFTGSSTQDLLTKHLRNPPPPLESTGRDVTGDFGELIRKMLAKNPANRPQTMQDVYKSMRGIKVFNLRSDAPSGREEQIERRLIAYNFQLALFIFSNLAICYLSFTRDLRFWVRNWKSHAYHVKPTVVRKADLRNRRQNCCARSGGL